MVLLDENRGKMKSIFVKWLFTGFFTSLTLLVMIIIYLWELI